MDLNARDPYRVQISHLHSVKKEPFTNKRANGEREVCGP